MSASNHDLSALLACATGDAALCTLVGLEGSFSRRVGAQIAIGADGCITGSLSDGCLEQQLEREAEAARASGQRRLVRFGAGSPLIDFRLPCGSGLDILVDPAPDRAALHEAVGQLEARSEAALALPVPGVGLLHRRRYIPPLRVLLFGEGPEFSAFEVLARAAGVDVRGFVKRDASGGTLSLGQVPGGLAADPWTAILLLFHDHEWERALLRWALTSSAFYIGAQGGRAAIEARRNDLLSDGHPAETIARLRSPIGLIARTRDPQVLAVSVLAEIMAGYEALHPHR